jgi:DsbC/DsbD-like thiol-disulfide interchange protein
MPALRKHASPAKRQLAYRQRREAGRIAELRAKGVPPAAAIPTMPSAARWNALIEMAQGMLGAAIQEMEDYRDERSEAWLAGEKGEAFQATLDLVNEALASVEAIE